MQTYLPTSRKSLCIYALCIYADLPTYLLPGSASAYMQSAYMQTYLPTCRKRLCIYADLKATLRKRLCIYADLPTYPEAVI